MAIPQTIGKYRVTKLLGSGGFGAVYLAEDPKLSGKVAIKVFAICNAGFYDLSKEIPSTSSLITARNKDLALRERFVREATLLRQLSTNPNIVDVYDFDEMADGTPYFVMPYLERSLVDEMGKDALTPEALHDLSNESRPRKLPVLRVVEILTEVLSGLVEVHSADLIHRDIKPANILFDANGRAQLCDFGVAKTPDSEHSETGVVMGSRNYMSPEQRESGKHVTAGSDIYSVGVLAYRMLTGTLPIGPCDDPVVYCPEMGVAFNELVLEALSPQREKRPADAGEFLQRLKKATSGSKSEDENDGSVTEIGPAPSSVRGELKKLEQTIEVFLLENGKVDQEQFKQLKMLAEIEGLNERALLQLITSVEKRLEVSIKPMQVFAAMVDDALAEARGSILEERLESLRKAGEQVGLAIETVERILDDQQTLYCSQRKSRKSISAPLAIIVLVVFACVCAGLLWWSLEGQGQQKEQGLSQKHQETLLSQSDSDIPYSISSESRTKESQAKESSEKLKNVSVSVTPIKVEPVVSVTTMLSIPGGQFIMGSTRYSKEERPIHTVTVQPFQLGETEVTWAQYQECIDSGACSNAASDQGWGKANRPVINVSWNDVQRYIQWINKKTGQRFRLPSEAEWEYAARAVTGKNIRNQSEVSSNTNYSWGDNIGENNANCDGCGSRWDDQQTAPVASFTANALGLHDMHGNVWEWVQDCWHDNYKGAPSNGRAWEVELKEKLKEKPLSQEQCRRRVLRGGSWHNVRGYLRSAYRSADSVESTYFNFGFRLAHD